MTGELKTQVDAITSNRLPARHTFFQLNFFVIGKEPTHQAKLRKCVEELKSRKTQVESAQAEIEDLEDRNALILAEKAKIEKDTFSFSEEEAKVKQRMIDRKVVQTKKTIESIRESVRNIEEEIVFFVEAFEALSQIEPLKNWDDIDVQTEYWNAKLMEDLNCRLLARMPIDGELIRCAMALPSTTPVTRKVLSLLALPEQKGKA